MLYKMENTNKAQFKQAVADNKLVLVDFYATWCGPCKMMAPVIEEINQEMSESVKVLKVDVDQEGDLAREYKITAIPTLVLIKSGKLVYSSMGFKPKNAIQELIRKNL